jgi:hypothetical protein
MRIAVLADIRANETALIAVLRELEHLRVDRMWFIGSQLSYGPDPVAVCDRLRSSADAECCLIGHPDGFMLSGGLGWHLNAHATQACLWAHRQLRPGWFTGRARASRWRWLQQRTWQGTEGQWQFYSGTPLEPAHDVLPVQGFDGRQEQLAPYVTAIAGGTFVGSLRVPGLLFADSLEWRRITDYAQPIPVGGRRFLVCPGSVGLPGDGDPRAGFVVCDNETITFHRVAYDVTETQRRIRAQPELNPLTAERLALGR